MSLNCAIANEVTSTSKLSLKKAKVAAFFAKQKVANGFPDLDRDAQSPRFSWIPRYQFTETLFSELDLGLTPVKNYIDDDLFYLVNLNLNFSWEIYWNLGVYLTGGAQQWIDNGGFFANYGGGLFYEFHEPLLGFISQINASYTIIPTPKETTVIELGTTVTF